MKNLKLILVFLLLDRTLNTFIPSFGGGMGGMAGMAGMAGMGGMAMSHGFGNQSFNFQGHQPHQHQLPAAPIVVPQGPILPMNNQVQPTCLLGQTPVCGMNLETYPNLCVMILLGQTKKSDGWCPEPVIETKITQISYKTPNNGFLAANQNKDPNSPCPCNSVYNPVCGNNGVSYGSRCRLECSNVALSHEGPCNYFNWNESPHYNCPCEYKFAPVCGQDGSTYENECTIKCGHQMIKHEGACMNPCNCSNVYKPVCSKKSKTFQNRCFMKCEKHKFFKKGKCPDRKPSHCSHCEGLNSPICGTNGLTYDNRCYMDCAGVEKYSEGVCPNDDSYEGVKSNIPDCSTCKNIFLPVCGADGVTYDSACKSRCNGVAIQYKGKCLGGAKSKSSGRCGCSSGSNPVCGVDGRTYENKCEAECKNINILYSSGCRPESPNYCSHLCGNAPVSPVCGKDWKTYANECVASKCMQVPIRIFESCAALNDSNYPTTFEYAKLSKVSRPATPMPPVQTTPMPPVQRNPQQNRGVNINQTVRVNTQGGGHSHGNSMAQTVSRLDLKNKDSVINTYKMLFPGGRPISPKVMSYKAPLEQILRVQFKIDPSHL